MSLLNDLPPQEQLLLSDFNAAAHAAYRAVCERELTSSIDPAYLGKPINNVWMLFERRRELPDGRVVVAEMNVGPISVADVELLQLLRPELPEDVLARYAVLARNLGGLAINNATNPARFVPMEGIRADYRDRYEDDDGWLQEVGTFTASPDENTIRAAIGFAQAALRYARSLQEPHFKQGVDPTPDEGMSHSVLFEMTPDLPLNGNESLEFLTTYAEDLRTTCGRLVEQLNLVRKMTGLGVSEELIVGQLVKYRAALRHVKMILDEQQR